MRDVANFKKTGYYLETSKCQNNESCDTQNVKDRHKIQNAIREQTKEKVDRQRNGVTKEKFIRIITDR